MINLEKYYREKVSKEDYYYKFYNELIIKADEDKRIMEELAFITDSDPYEEALYDAYDEEDVIKIVKDLCEPNLDIRQTINTRKFYFAFFYLHDNGYKIVEFPRVIDRPPEDPYTFTCLNIRNLAIEKGMEFNGTVSYMNRRKIVANLTFEKKDIIKIDEGINKLFVEISTRNAKFESMSKDEQIKEIANLIENMLYIDGKYIELDCEKKCFNLVTNDCIKKYRKQIQCFRHAHEEALRERKNIDDVQKDFIIDYGITIIKLIYRIK